MKDMQILEMIEKETERQLYNIELIASENYVSKDVLEAAGSILTNKYAEGYPAKRYYVNASIITTLRPASLPYKAIPCRIFSGARHCRKTSASLPASPI